MSQRDVDFDEPRFTTPICTLEDVADIVGMPLETVKTWAGQRRSRRQMITRYPQTGHRGWPSIPLVGLVEANTLRTLREVLPPSEVEAAADWIKQKYATPFALANKQLVTDGAFAYVRENDLVWRVRTQQHAIVEVIEEHLKPLVFEADEYPVAYSVRIPGVVIDPRFNAGRMSFVRNRVPVFAVLGSLRGGDSVDEVMRQYDLTLQEVAAVDEHGDWAATAA